MISDRLGAASRLLAVGQALVMLVNLLIAAVERLVSGFDQVPVSAMIKNKGVLKVAIYHSTKRLI